MSPILRNLALISLFLAAVNGHAAVKASNAQATIADIQKLLGETQIDATDLPKRMPLAKLLAALETRLPKDKNISLRIDMKAIGKKLGSVAKAEVATDRLNGKTLAKAIELSLAQLDERLDYAVRPAAVVITLPRLASYSTTYDVRDLVRHEQLRIYLKKQEGALDKGSDSDGMPSLLVQFLVNELELQPWESIEILNGTQLDIVASFSRQLAILELLTALRQLSDLAVIMNARLYEVDRTFFAKHVAPLYAKGQDGVERSIIQRVDGPLFKTIAQQKLLAMSEDDKIEPGTLRGFLSKQSAFRFAAPARTDNAGRPGAGKLIGSDLAGVSFEVRPMVSPDRRYLRLQITRKVAQIMSVDKNIGPEGEKIKMESPNVRKSSVTGTIQIPDGSPILMRVDYRPPGENGDDKVWLMLARPMIWIEAEIEERRGDGPPISPKSYWDVDVPDTKPKREHDNRLSDDRKVKEILDAVVKHVLTDPEMKGTREFYGTASDKTFMLVDGNVGWPKQFRPETHGFELTDGEHDPFVEQRRLLGIRLDKFDLKQKAEGLFNTPIEISLLNVGGSANGGVIGGASVHYVPKREGGHWTVEFHGMHRP